MPWTLQASPKHAQHISSSCKCCIFVFLCLIVTNHDEQPSTCQPILPHPRFVSMGAILQYAYEDPSQLTLIRWVGFKGCPRSETGVCAQYRWFHKSQSLTLHISDKEHTPCFVHMSTQCPHTVLMSESSTLHKQTPCFLQFFWMPSVGHVVPSLRPCPKTFCRGAKQCNGPLPYQIWKPQFKVSLIIGTRVESHTTATGSTNPHFGQIKPPRPWVSRHAEPTAGASQSTGCFCTGQTTPTG